MEEYRIPAGPSEAELVEKKSRFIGQVFPAETEEEARACIEAVRKKHYDARHHCFCYRLANGTVRASGSRRARPASPCWRSLTARMCRTSCAS